MERNAAYDRAVAMLERKFHEVIVELKQAGEMYEGEELLKATERIQAKFNLAV